MRILLTKNGKTILTEIEEESQNSTKKSIRARSIPLKRILPSLAKIKTENKMKSRNDTKINKSKSFIFNDGTNKMIRLKSKKISMPKGFETAYDPVNEKDGILIDSTFGTLPPKTNKFNTISETDSNLFSFKEILPKNILTSSKLQLMAKEKEKERNFICDSSNFRTEYNETTPLFRFKKLVEYPTINDSRGSLIRYLNTREKVTPLTIRNISECDQQKLGRINKMAQIVLHENERQKIREERIKEKIKVIKNHEVAQTTLQRDSAKEDISQIKSTLDSYIGRKDKKDNYKALHYEVVKYWRSKKYDKMTPSQLDHSFLENFRKEDEFKKNGKRLLTDPY